MTRGTKLILLGVGLIVLLILGGIALRVPRILTPKALNNSAQGYTLGYTISR